MAFQITTLHAYIATDEDGEEGVIGFLTPQGTWMPMVAADRTRIECLRPMAQAVADQTGQQIVLAEFSVRTDLETLEPAS